MSAFAARRLHWKGLERFYVRNFGCRASQADGAAIEAGLAARGLEPAPDSGSASLVVLNTCTVTATADDEVRQVIRRVRRENPGARILVTGCYAQRAPEEISRLEGVSLVVGNSHKTRIPELATQPDHFHGEIHVSDIFAQHDFLAAPVADAAGDRSRPNLKIQDGCNNRCSFCVIPYVRGRSRSMPPQEVIHQVRGLAERYPEVVLSGVNLGRWGRESGSGRLLAGLLRQILAETPVRKLRLSSIEPMDWSGELLELMASEPRIAKHVHAPLQSGSDAVLRRMHRKYRPRHYEDRIRRAHALMPDAAFGADVMVGFPGETEAEFEETLRFVESLPFTYLHVFTYSERPGTPAALREQVPWAVRKERNARLRELGERKNLEFRRRMVGRELDAVVLDNGTKALTDNYLHVELCRPKPVATITRVRVGGLGRLGLVESGTLAVLVS
jgi:threonylcarbamoyladenosine tRNA methylthiotransferase MtaB